MNDPRRVRFGKRWVVIAALIVIIALLAKAGINAQERQISLSQSVSTVAPGVSGNLDAPLTLTPLPYSTEASSP